MRSPADRRRTIHGAKANEPGKASRVSQYHKLLARVDRNPNRWVHLAMTVGRQAIGNIIEQGRGSAFIAFAFDAGGRTLGTFGSRKAARRAVYDAAALFGGRAAS